jgi:hypothetical protein
MGLRVPLPDPSTTVPVVQPAFVSVYTIAIGAPAPAPAPAPVPQMVQGTDDGDGLCDFDELDIWQVCSSFFILFIYIVRLELNSILVFVDASLDSTPYQFLTARTLLLSHLRRKNC